MNRDSTEFELLLACLRWLPTQSDSERIEKLLVNGSIQINLFLELVEYHQVAPIVFRNLSGFAPAAIDDDLKSKLREKALASAARSFRRIVEHHSLRASTPPT